MFLKLTCNNSKKKKKLNKVELISALNEETFFIIEETLKLRHTNNFLFRHFFISVSYFP